MNGHPVQLRRRTRRELGFTLIELMIAVTLSAIVLSLAVPSLRAIVQDNRQVTRLNDLVTDLAYARSEAVRRGISVAICPFDANGDGARDVAAAGDSCGSNADWTSGWVVFLDENRDGALADAADVVRLYDAITGSMDLTFNNANIIRFDAQGLAIGSAGTFTLCDERGAAHARGRVLNNTGRIREADGSLSCS